MSAAKPAPRKKWWVGAIQTSFDQFHGIMPADKPQYVAVMIDEPQGWPNHWLRTSGWNAVRRAKVIERVAPLSTFAAFDCRRPIKCCW